MLINSITAAASKEQSHFRLTKKHLSLLVIIVSFIAFLVFQGEFVYQLWIQLSQRELDPVIGPKYLSLRFTFSISCAAVALIVAGTYYYAYRHFEQNFYFYLFMNWVANAAYLIAEVNGPETDLKYNVGVFFLSLISAAFMLLALMRVGEKKREQSEWRNVFTSISTRAWGNILIGCVAGIGLNIYILSVSAGNPTENFLGWLSLVDTAISFVLLCAVGENLKLRLSGKDDKRKGRIALTFYVYGVMQFIYPFRHLLSAMNLFPILFALAQILKVINAILMMGAIQTARDKERETAAQALAEKEKKLERQTRYADLGVLAASIKHDINTPLATMGSHIAAIKNNFSKDPDIIKSMEKLDQSITRISAIANIVDYIRKDDSLMDSESLMRRAGMIGIAKSAVELVKGEKVPIMGKTRIEIKGREAYVRALVPLLEQVLVNIIKNGLEAIVEAMQEKGLIVIHVSTVKITDSKYSRWVKVEISDNGRGIPEEHIVKLATGFTTRGEKKPNSGIGLLTGKRIVNIHGGKLKFESKIGEGTTVTLLLPEWSAFHKAARQHAESGHPEVYLDEPSVDHDTTDVLVSETTYPHTTEITRKTGGTE
jgi:signal transduction histidine kinase